MPNAKCSCVGDVAAHWDDSFAFSILHSALLRLSQRKHIDRVVSARRLQARLLDEASSQRAFAREHSDILLAVDGIRDGAVLNRSLKRDIPQNLSAHGIERPESFTDIAPEHQISGGSKHR